MNKSIIQSTFLLFLSLFLWTNTLLAQCIGTPSLNLYWVGNNGTGNFNDPNNWRVGSINSIQKPCQSPRSSDNIYFTAASFPITGAIVNVDMNSNCLSMIWDDIIATVPTFAGTFDKNLEVFGHLILPNPNAINFNYNGSLIFKGSGNNIYDLDTKGNNLRLNDFRISLDNAATLRLISPLVLNNRNNTNTSNNAARLGGNIYHITGHFNTNGQSIDADGFMSTTNNTSKKITFNNSRIHLKTGGWYPDLFQISNIVSANFSAQGAHIIIEDNPASSLTENIVFNANARFDSVTIKTNKARTNWSGKLVANYIHIDGVGTICNNANLETTTLKLNPGVILAITSTSAEIAFDNLIMPNNCSDYAIIQGTLNGSIAAKIRKKSIGNLVMNNLILQKVEGNTTGGRTYIANNSFNTGLVNNITVNNPSNCPTELYFRQTAGNSWNTPQNWYDAAGNPAMQIPNPGTNVFFNAASGNGTIAINSNVGYCKDITWLNTINNGITFNLNYALMVLGNVTFQGNMTQVTGSNYNYEIVSGLNLYGNGKTFTTNGAKIPVNINMSSASDYTFIDSLYCNTLNMNAGAMMRANNIGINLARFAMGDRIWTNTRLHTRGGGWPQISQTSANTVIYNDSCIFYINDAGTGQAQTLSGIFPHTIVNSAADISPSWTIRGDLHIKQSANLAFRTGANATVINVSGNVFFDSGIEVVLSGGVAGHYLRVQGNLTAIGSCTKPTTIRTQNGNPIEFNIAGLATLENCFLKGLNSTHPINAINSTDGTNNSNITFSNGVGTTYYWRAKNNNPNNFVGNWSDPAHWTTNPNKTTGDSACIPSLADNVVFDVLSRSTTSNGCTIDGQAYCKNLTATSNININANNIDRMWYIAGSFNIANTVNISNYRGSIYMIGEGVFNFTTNGLKLFTKELMFDNVRGTWNILAPLELDDAFNSTYSGKLLLNAGNLHLNGNDLIIHNSFTSETNMARSLNFENATITIVMSGFYQASGGIFNRPWSITNANTMQLQAGDLEFLDNSNSTDINLRFGDNLAYKTVKITEAAQVINLHGTPHIQYGDFNSSLKFLNNMSFDSMAVYGGKTYVLQAGSRQTLSSPHGKLISFGTSSSFVNLQSSAIGSKAYIYKDHGNGFCIDFLKVQDIIAQRQNNIALVPSPYNTSHTANLFFDTGDNCDDINGSATSDPSSIWRFSLQPLETPRFNNGTVMEICAYNTFPATFPLAITGTSPYVINYAWSTNTESGSGIITEYDDDNNAATPYYANIPLNTTNANVTYTFQITTYRCGEATTGIGSSTRIQQPTANTLTMEAQNTACYFNNEDNWRTMVGATNQKPILSINDYTGANDIAALMNVNASVSFTPSIQYVNLSGISHPYLQRWWKIQPSNNTKAKVRLYFTQTELNNLASNSNNFAGNQSGILNPETQIQVVKFSSGIIGVGPYTIIPHTVIPLAGANASAFTNTNGVIAIEFQSPDFSAFIITPNQSALLSANLQTFEVEKTSKGEAQIDWTIADSREIAYFELEYSLNAQSIETITMLESNQIQGIDTYNFLHTQTSKGYNYYRLKTISQSGNIYYSAWKTIDIDGFEGEYQAYPNPTSGILNIALPESASTDILIYNSLGQLVESVYQTADLKIHTLNIQHLASGMYTVQIKIEGSVTKSIPIIKQ